ncbi:MAG: hypothetical protein K8S24_11510, partial [Candidatus Aegiribacteria sp.]|nr:hypothetical protein [Candidatus Aegiribacteria sp.]
VFLHYLKVFEVLIQLFDALLYPHYALCVSGSLDKCSDSSGLTVILIDLPAFHRFLRRFILFNIVIVNIMSDL